MAPNEALASRPMARTFNAALGGLLLACGAWIAFGLPASSVGDWLCAAALGLVGAESLWAALRGQRSWLSRVGPLP